MNYSQSLEYIFSHLPMFHRVGAAAYKPDLGNITALCKSLGDPQRSFRSVHIAGTNGKGSTSHMLASVLMEAGFKTGLFTSPHLTDFRERIRVNGKMIPKSRVARFITGNRSGFERIRPSFFEMTTALAFEYFRDEKVDIAVLETGMGGRLDSTNIITPLLSVITNISFDHAQFLGDTLEKIAFEKAGIIKPGVPVVIGETQPDIQHVFIEKARELNAPVTFADAMFVLESAVGGSLLTVVAEEKGSGTVIQVQSPLTGSYQVRNILTVMEATRVLGSAGIGLSERHVESGIRQVIKNTGIRGRWQVLSKKPLTICDTGHNEGGLREVVRQIRNTPHDRLHVVFGVVEDKDLKKVLDMLPVEAIYYFCKADVPRGLPAGILKQAALEAGFQGQDYPSVRAAYLAARSAAKPGDLIFIGGSTFVVAEVL